MKQRIRSLPLKNLELRRACAMRHAPHGASRMSMLMPVKKHSAALSSGMAVLAPMPCLASEVLTARYACIACHQPSQKSVGPSWQQIAEKSRADGKTAAQPATSIRSGGSGRWGAMPMPPQPLVPDADLQALAAWILAYDK